MKMEEDYDSSSDSSDEEQSPLDLIVKATDGSITMEQQAMLLKLYTEMLKNQPQETKETKTRRVEEPRNPMAQVKVTSSLVPPKPCMKLAGPYLPIPKPTPEQTEVRERLKRQMDEEYDREIEREIAEEKRQKEMEKLMLRMQIEKEIRKEIKEQQSQQAEEYQNRFVKPQAHFPGFYDVVVKQKPQLSEEENPEKSTCQVTTTCPF